MIEKKCRLCVYPEINIKEGICSKATCRIKSAKFRGGTEMPNWMRGEPLGRKRKKSTDKLKRKFTVPNKRKICK